MNDSPNRDVEIFTAAVQLPATERAAFLDRTCGNDAELRHEVLALLKYHDSGGDFLQQSPHGAAVQARLEASIGVKLGDRIGRYKLLRQIGEGGCGVVYLAEQQEPVRRRVALKVIKPGTRADGPPKHCEGFGCGCDGIRSAVFRHGVCPGRQNHGLLRSEFTFD